MSVPFKEKKDAASLLREMDRPGNRWPVTVLSKVAESLEMAYGSGLAIYLASERWGLRKRFRVPVPVISIGNLSVGGTGKTPAVIAFGLALQGLGLKVVVLSRGHGGSLSRQGGIVSDDQGEIRVSTKQSGDEPMVLALAMPKIPVLVGKDRRKTAMIAVEKFSPDIILLDDGFQYWQLRRDIDIVLLDAAMPFDNGHCLPRGLLREPKNNLSRASYVIVTRSSKLSPDDKEKIDSEIRDYAKHVKIYFSEHVGSKCIASNSLAVDLGDPSSPIAVCAIAKPQSFLETIVSLGIDPVDSVFFSDHHQYSASDAATITKLIKKRSADSVVTTQKDFVKLGPLLKDVPVFVQPITFKVDDLSSLVTEIFNKTVMARNEERRSRNG